MACGNKDAYKDCDMGSIFMNDVNLIMKLVSVFECDYEDPK